MFIKKIKERILAKTINQQLVDQLIRCWQSMQRDIQRVVTQIDSLEFITEMPYICHDRLCGDNLFWKAVTIGKSNIELLIDKLDDTTTTNAHVPNFGGNYTAADIAFSAINEIIHNIPTFQLLGVPFDKNGCGYCTYWQHLDKSFANRKKFKLAVWNWYYQNRDKLTWVKSNQFSACDCSGEHPNQGHYIVKKTKTTKKQ